MKSFDSEGILTQQLYVTVNRSDRHDNLIRIDWTIQSPFLTSGYFDAVLLITKVCWKGPQRAHNIRNQQRNQR